MNWKKRLINLFSEGDYRSSIHLLEGNILKGIDLRDSYLNLQYTYLHLIVESDLPNHHDFIPILRNIFQDAYSRYIDDPEYLFYTAYTGMSYGEFYLGLREDDLEKMFKSALNLTYNNLLYQWGYKVCVNAMDGKENCKYAIEILNDAKYVDNMNEKALVGHDLLKHLQLFADNSF